METPNPNTIVDTDKDIGLNMVENNIPHSVEVMETTNLHPHPNMTVGTDKDTRFNMVEDMGPDTQLNLMEEDMGPDIQLNLTEEVMEVRIQRWEPDPEIPWQISLPL